MKHTTPTKQGNHVFMHLSNATVKGTVSQIIQSRTYKHPVVTTPPDGMVKLIDITRCYEAAYNTHNAWLEKKPVKEMIGFLLSCGLEKEEVSCVKETMSYDFRDGHKMNGGVYVHPLLADRYEMYLNEDPKWYDIDSFKANFKPHKEPKPSASTSSPFCREDEIQMLKQENEQLRRCIKELSKALDLQQETIRFNHTTFLKQDCHINALLQKIA